MVGVKECLVYFDVVAPFDPLEFLFGFLLRDEAIRLDLIFLLLFLTSLIK